MSIRVICTVSLLFSQGKTSVIAPALQIVTLPDWVQDTKTYQVNLKAGRIKEMDTSTNTKKVEKIQEKVQDQTPAQQSAGLEKEISKMKKAELQEYCRNHNIEYKPEATNPELIDLIRAYN